MLYNIQPRSELTHKRGPAASTIPKSLLTIKKMCCALALVDVWRSLNPARRDYTFFSAVHDVFTRIDYFFISKEILPSTMSSAIGNILISDRARVTLDLVPINDVTKSPRWRFNSSLLQDDAFKAMLRTQIESFVEINIASVSLVGTVWEALKAFIRGHVIQFSSHKKIQDTRKLADLERKVGEAEDKLKQNYSPQNLKTVMQLKYDYNWIISQKVEFGLFRARQRYFESGDKPGNS